MSTTSRVIFPLCGITYHDAISVAGMSMTAAARKLGIEEDHFATVINRLGMRHWYPRSYDMPRCITAEDIANLAAEGYNRRDAAHLSGLTYSHFNVRVREYGLSHLFPTKGKASWISRRGYVGKDT